MQDLIKKMNFKYKKANSLLPLSKSDILYFYKAGSRFIDSFLMEKLDLRSQAQGYLANFLADHKSIVSDDELTLLKHSLSNSGPFAPGGDYAIKIDEARNKSADGSDEAILSEISKKYGTFLHPDFDEVEFNRLSLFVSLHLYNPDMRALSEKDLMNSVFQLVLREMEAYQTKYGKKADGPISISFAQFVGIMQAKADKFGPWFNPSDEELLELKKIFLEKFPGTILKTESGSELDWSAA